MTETPATKARRGRPPKGGREAILTAALQLLREKGIARLTTREVAEQAGVSEASVFYHYGDRAGLLTAVLAEGLLPLKELNAAGGLQSADLTSELVGFGAALEGFLQQALPVMAAAQADAGLRDAMSEYMREHDMGSHRGVIALGAYLEGEQAAGRIRDDVDPEVIAAMFIGALFIRIFQTQTGVETDRMPSASAITEALATLLAPRSNP